MTISKSPQRHTFQRDCTLNRALEEGTVDSEDVQAALKMYETWRDIEPAKGNNLEYDLRTTEWILEKCRADEQYAQHIYAALCNNEFIHRDTWTILKDETWSCSWRSAGGIVADMLQEGDYIDWYCSGMRGEDMPPEAFVELSQEEQITFLKRNAFVPEGVITDEIARDFHKLGWLIKVNKS